ncbi:hypothetical protein B5E65_09975 [Gemmiger sp. An120]|uniref:tape measure protein n=1 Tax=Gemmiger sp. An120 TaxID=1965549 RepID=UPI000B3652CD|nr:tape measure protein [Gemmiger sp. An120]OUQ41840.1 hypothetical protein B5E65_09975 [Gemmiger sp. An120]
MGYDGSIIFDTHIDTSGFTSGTKDVNNELSNIGKGAEDAARGLGELPEEFDKTAESAGRLEDIVKGGAVFKVIEKGVSAVVASLDSAIDRVDTMNRFPMMMEQMGYSAEAAQSAVDKLSKGVQGLPTTLDSVVSTAQRLTILTDNLEQSVDTTIALNNAFLASGSGAEGAARGLEQYVQMLSRGEVDLEGWRTLQETMGIGLTRVAESFGYAGQSAQTELYDALKNGDITIQQFNARLIELNNGVGGFADLAKTSSVGIRTAWTNMSTAVVRGTASIVTSVDEGLSKTKFKSIQNSIETMGKGAEAALKALAPAFGLVASNADTLAVVLGVLAVAYGANKAVTAFTAAQKVAAAAILAADAAGIAAVPTLNAQAVAEARATAAKTLGAKATAAQTAAQMAQNGVMTAGTFVLGGMTTGMGLATVASGLLTAATTALGTAIKIAMGPVGWITAGITLLVAGATALYKWITADSEAYTEQADAIDQLASAQEELAQSNEASLKTYEESVKALSANADAASALTREMDELNKADEKSATQKLRMGAIVAELNEQYQDLCLVYDDETDQLNMTTKQLRDYIRAHKEMEQAATLQERYNELLEEEATIRQNQTELTDKEAELESQLEQKLLTTSEYNELLEQLNDTRAGYIEQEQEIAAQEEELKSQLADLDTTWAQQTIANTQAVQEANEAAAEAREQELERQTKALETYTAAATNYMDQLDTKTEVSVSDMIANLEHNQKAVAEWAANLDELAARGIDQGLLQHLRDAGPEAAGQVAALVNATDAQLQRMSELFANGTDVAVQALLTELGLPETAESAGSAGSSLVDNVAAGVDANASLTASTQKLIEDAKRTAQASVSANDFPSVGKSMMDGITAGVNAGASGLVNAMVAAVESAVAAAKATADIHSPSKVFRRVIGLNIMRGWALGVEDGEPLVSQSVVDAMESLRREVAGGTDPAGLVRSMRTSVADMQAAFAGQIRSAGPTAIHEKGSATGNITNYTQNVYFEDTMQAPDEIARALRIQNTYGMAGER